MKDKKMERRKQKTLPDKTYVNAEDSKNVSAVLGISLLRFTITAGKTLSKPTF